MECYHQGRLLKTYRISLGFSPRGHKEQEGDGKTPEGVYFIEAKNIKSKFHKSLKISYPNSEDRKAASLRKASPGGDIMIHGLGKTWGFLKSSHLLHDWTLGCIAVTNEEIDEIFPAVSTGTRIEIFP
jgi:murein L,D-transpeptidase YafK